MRVARCRTASAPRTASRIAARSNRSSSAWRGAITAWPDSTANGTSARPSTPVPPVTSSRIGREVSSGRRGSVAIHMHALAAIMPSANATSRPQLRTPIAIAIGTSSKLDKMCGIAPRAVRR